MRVRKEDSYKDLLGRFEAKSSEKIRENAYVKTNMKFILSNGIFEKSIKMFLPPLDKGSLKYIRKSTIKWLKKRASYDFLVDPYYDQHANIVQRISKLEAFTVLNDREEYLTLRLINNGSFEAFASPLAGNETSSQKEYFFIYDLKLIHLFDLISVFLSSTLIIDRSKNTHVSIKLPEFYDICETNRKSIKFLAGALIDLENSPTYSDENIAGNLKLRMHLYESCAVFMFAHELSHIALGHLENNNMTIKDQEIEADKVTAQLMVEYGSKYNNPLCKSIMTPPFILNFIDVILEAGLDKNISDTHLVTSDRIKIFSDILKYKMSMHDDIMYNADQLSTQICEITKKIKKEYNLLLNNPPIS